MNPPRGDPSHQISPPTKKNTELTFRYLGAVKVMESIEI